MDEVTATSDPGRYAALLAQWEQEHRPGWLVTKNTTYQVLRLKDDEIRFRRVGAEALYDSTSF